jgi:hypothetical protein
MAASKPFRTVAAVDLDDTVRATWAAAVALLANPEAEVSLLHVIRATEREVRNDTADVAAMTPFSTYNARLFPTGIPRKQVR